jgi:rRNA maturation endonuclease Nob1
MGEGVMDKLFSICQNCGEEFTDDFCEACGTSLQSMQYQYAVEQADNYRDEQREEGALNGPK